MSRIKEIFMKIFNKIFKRNQLLMLTNVSKENYEKYHTTYDTPKKAFGNIEDIDKYLIENISAQIQTNQDLYRQKTNSLEDKVNEKLDTLYMKSTTKTPEEIIEDIIKSHAYSKVIVEHPETKLLLDNWKEKSKNYTYRDKIRLIGEEYSRKLQDFDKKDIDNAISFLKKRYQNYGRDNEDIELSDEAKEIFELKTKYGKEIKKIFIDNNIDLTHITSISPKKLEGGVLRKSIDSLNMYETERVDAVFASSTPIDGKNPYIAWKDGELVKLGDSEYIYGNNNIEITKDSEGKNHAMLKEPNYIYHINPEKFEPVCNFTIDKITNEPVFEFSDEWISNTEVDISDNNQVRKVEEVRDVTSILENHTILCDKYSQRIGMKAITFKNKEEGIKFIAGKIREGSVRNINEETGINDRYSQIYNEKDKSEGREER